MAWGLVAAVVLLLILGVRAVTGGDDYSPRALAVAEQSTRLGRDVAGLRAQLKSVDRLSLFRRMRAWAKDARTHLDAARDLEPGADGRIGHGNLLTALSLRAEALRRFDPAVRKALSDQDVQVAASQLLAVMHDLELGDRSYELFAEAWPRAASRRPPESTWVADAADATIEGVTGFVRELRKQESLELNANLAIASVTVDPKPVGKERDQDLLPFTRSMSVSVVVQNTGNQQTGTTPIAAILTSESDPVQQAVEGSVGTLRPGEKRSVTLRPLEPTTGGPINLLRVTLGPATGERNTLDNVQEYKFSMRKP